MNRFFRPFLMALALFTMLGCDVEEDVEESVTVLRENIGMDLSQVSSFAVVLGPEGHSLSLLSGLRSLGTLTSALEYAGLVALTLDGEVLAVSLVEGSSGTGAVNEPLISGIYPTSSWIFFSTGDFVVYEFQEDGSNEEIGCSIIAARRADGALYCADLKICSGGDGFPLDRVVKANAAGDVTYIGSRDAMDRNILYKLTLSEDAPPIATLVDALLHPAWFDVNAAGDLLVNFTPPGSGQAVTQVLPVDGGEAFVVTGEHNAYATCGKTGGVDENVFYVVSGGGGGWAFDGTIRAVSKDGSSFVEALFTVTMADMNCSGLFRLSDGFYMVCFSGDEKTLARVVEDGAVVANPSLISLEGVDNLLDLDGLPFRAADGYMVFHAGDAAGRKFVRHDGVTQEDIPLDARIELMWFVISQAGDIDFMGVYTDTNEKVRGTVAAGSTEVTILSVEGLDLAEVVAFTRIN